jgi:3-deoxy-D-manno-octulosonic-acid transferase
VYGKPVIHGPEYSKFAEAEGLLEAGGSIVINSAIELEARLNALLQDEQDLTTMGNKAGLFVQIHTGASQAVLQHIQENLRLTSE